MPRLIGYLPSGLLLPLLAGPVATADVVRLTPEQVNRAGVVTSALPDMKVGGAIRLPAQVVVPPSQIEVMAAPLPAMVGAVSVAYGATKFSSPMA